MTDTDALIDDWFNARFYNSAISRNTEAFNAALVAKEDLKAILKNAMGTTAAHAAAAAQPVVTEDDHVA